MAALSSTGVKKEKSKKQKKAHLFRFGNYNRYYGYRVGRERDEDPRLKLFQREWFDGKDCLDVGCNEGIVTISIAQKYNCKSMLGMDLDGGLIVKANENLEAALGELGDHTDVLTENDTSIAAAQTFVQNGIDGEELRGLSNVESGGADPAPLYRKGLRGVRFQEEQFIDNFPHGDFLKDGTFDTILCLSVTKWVHLNWGDMGLINLFCKIYRILRMGGILILEPQPWKSYVSKNNVSERTMKNFSEIVLRPDHFKAILLDKIGFKSVTEISKAVPNSTKGFNRALFLYTK